MYIQYTCNLEESVESIYSSYLERFFCGPLLLDGMGWA